LGTPQEIDHIRRAIAAIQLHRSGRIPLAPEHEGKALDIVEKVAADTGLPLEDILAGYDPDPRVGSVEPKKLHDVLLDLDEQERSRCISLIVQSETSYRRSEGFDETNLPTLWAMAHDRAIIEVNHARAIANLNGTLTWNSRSWGGRRDANRRKA
jgi:hypothetical protein